MDETGDCAALQLNVEDGIARVAISDCSVRALNDELCADLIRVCEDLKEDADVSVVIFESNFLDPVEPYGDVRLPVHLQTFAGGYLRFIDVAEVQRLRQLLHCIAGLPQLTIGKLDGLERVGGDKVAMACDVCFAMGGAFSSPQTEILLGYTPSSGTPLFSRHVGSGLVIGAVISADLAGADNSGAKTRAHRIVNASEIDGVVTALAKRVASFPKAIVRSIKRSPYVGEAAHLEDSLLEQKAIPVTSPAEGDGRKGSLPIDAPCRKANRPRCFEAMLHAF